MRQRDNLLGDGLVTLSAVGVVEMALGNIVLGAAAAAAIAVGAAVVLSVLPQSPREADPAPTPAVEAPPSEAPASEAAPSEAPAPEAPPAQATEARPQPEPAPALTAAAGPPSTEDVALDVARIEPDGSALFAGRAPPGTEVEVRIDGAVVGTARADASGAFVAFGAAPGGGVHRVEVVRKDATAAVDPVLLASPEVEGPEAPPTVVLQSRPEGVALIQTPPRPPGQAVTLDLLSYAEDGAIELAGRGDVRLPVRIWADALMIAETVVRDDGRWSARAATPLAPGAYVLRVEALADDGSVRFAVTSPFRREAPDRAAVREGDLVIQPGDTLWRIAERRYGQGVRYTLIFSANADRIRDPDLIYPGQVFRLPEPAAD